MSSRIEPSLHEVLNYPDESRRMLMQGFAAKLEQIALLLRNKATA